MRRVSVTCVACWILIALAGIGCDRPVTHASGDGEITVAVSIVPQAWLVRQIGGQHVDVLTLVNPGRQPETYQPTDADVSKVMAAAAYFCIGVPFENGRWFEVIRSSKEVRIVDTRQGIPLRSMTGHAGGPLAGVAENVHTHAEGSDAHDSHQHGGLDPHIWLCPRLLKVQARTVARALGQLDPSHMEDYQQNLRACEARLDQLDNTLRRTLAPLRGNTFLVLHPAWGYFADEYGLQQIAIEVEGSQPSDHQLTQLQKLARQEQIGVVFVQPQISSRSAQAVARAIGASVHELDPLAPDVATNLVHAAEAIARSHRETYEPERSGR